MRNKLIALLILGFIGGLLFLGVRPVNEHILGVNTDTDTETRQYKPSEACEVLTNEKALQLIPGVNQAQTPQLKPTSPDILLSQCLYTQPKGDSLESIRTQEQLSLIIRGALNPSGATHNKTVFNQQKSLSNNQTLDVSGYEAFWESSLGLLHVLKNDDVYIFSIGGSNPATRQIDKTTQMAEYILIN